MEKSNFPSVLKRIYPVVLAIALFTGFGNMPIYKRYYISNIPGLGWSGNFYINLYVHYIAGAFLLGLAVYSLLVHLNTRTSNDRLTFTGILRTITLGLLLLSGILLAVRNLSEINFALTAQMSLSFLHLAMAMILLLLSIACTLMKNPWRRLH